MNDGCQVWGMCFFSLHPFGSSSIYQLRTYEWHFPIYLFLQESESQQSNSNPNLFDSSRRRRTFNCCQESKLYNRATINTNIFDSSRRGTFNCCQENTLYMDAESNCLCSSLQNMRARPWQELDLDKGMPEIAELLLWLTQKRVVNKSSCIQHAYFFFFPPFPDFPAGAVDPEVEAVGSGFLWRLWSFPTSSATLINNTLPGSHKSSV